jgi:hypothetical protein
MNCFAFDGATNVLDRSTNNNNHILNLPRIMKNLPGTRCELPACLKGLGRTQNYPVKSTSIPKIGRKPTILRICKVSVLISPKLALLKSHASHNFASFTELAMRRKSILYDPRGAVARYQPFQFEIAQQPARVDVQFKRTLEGAIQKCVTHIKSLAKLTCGNFSFGLCDWFFRCILIRKLV